MRFNLLFTSFFVMAILIGSTLLKFALLASILWESVKGSALPAPRWTNPCNGAVVIPSPPPTTAFLLSNLKIDVNDTELATIALKAFFTQGVNPRISSSTEQALLTYTIENFPFDFVSNSQGVLGDVLLADYKFLSRVAIFYEEMIVNENFCALPANTNDMVTVRERVYNTLCHVDTTLRVLGKNVTTFETRDAVLPSYIKDIKTSPQPCTDNDSYRMSYDFIVIRDTLKYLSELRKQYTAIFNGLNNSG